MLLSRPGVLRLPSSLRDDPHLWTHPAPLRLPDHAAPAARQVPCRERQDATRETHAGPHTLPKVGGSREKIGTGFVLGSLIKVDLESMYGGGISFVFSPSS